jgi:hypothetical protein
MIVLGNGDEMCFVAVAAECVHVLESPKDHAKGHMINRQTVTVDWPLRSHGICGGRRDTGTVFSAGSSVPLSVSFHTHSVFSAGSSVPLSVSFHTHSQTECNDSTLKYNI